MGVPHQIQLRRLLSKTQSSTSSQGFHQRPGLDYTEAFSPVIKPVIVRLVLSLDVTNNWPLRQIDINDGFLQGTLTEDVFMVQPSGFVDSTKPPHVYHLRKAIYGLKQAPARAWYTEFRTYLTSLGFINSFSDTSLFYYHGIPSLYVLVYIDDIIITASCTTTVSSFIAKLGA